MNDKRSPAAAPAAQHSPSSATSVGFSNPENSLALTPPEIEEIHRLHDEVWIMRRKSLENGVRIGEILTKLKQGCGHGKWLPFVEENLPFCERTAQVYMGFYRDRELLKSADSADLPMYQALRLMTKAHKRSTNTATSPNGPRVLARLPVPNAPQPDAESASQTSPEGSETGTMQIINSDDQTSVEAPTPDAGTSINGSDPSQSQPEPPSQSDDLDQKDEEVTFRFIDGELVVGWEDGPISAEKVERDLRKIERLAVSLPKNVQLAQQRVFVAGAREINRVCGTDPGDDMLKAIESALVELRNPVVTHKNYLR